MRGRDSVRSYITELFQTRITMYDGAMGTMIQKHKLDEPDFRAERFKDYDMLIKGNNDLLSITQPHIIRDIYKKYLVEGGSQLIGTNTFSSTTIAQADYKMEDLVYELNYDSARLAREACDEVTAMDPTKPRFVCGAGFLWWSCRTRHGDIIRDGFLYKRFARNRDTRDMRAGSATERTREPVSTTIPSFPCRRRSPLSARRTGRSRRYRSNPTASGETPPCRYRRA